MSYYTDVVRLYERFGFPNPGDGEGGPRLLPPDLLDLAIKHLQEELAEFEDACAAGDLAEATDALVDLVVVALGRASMMRLDFNKHWREVQRANWEKDRVRSEGESKRGNKLDLKKPPGWTPPDHEAILQGTAPPDPMKWEKFYLHQARFVAEELSKDPTTKVGAVIVGRDRRRTAFGYNGLPSKLKDSPERLSDRVLKHKLTQHAERNALDFASFDTEGATMATTMCPCSECAKSIISKGIVRVIMPEAMPAKDPWAAEAEMALWMLSDAGIEVVKLDTGD